MYTCKHVLSNGVIDMKIIPWWGYYMCIDQGTWFLTCEESIKQLNKKTAVKCGSYFAETVTAKVLCLNLHGFAYYMELHKVARSCAELCGTAWDWCRRGYGKSSVPIKGWKNKQGYESDYRNRE
ncbi:hypothetical protein F5877DRAFT_72284 [Lentinula edodes]|nr:hypothetical protein F5877DRAFT_72284 [Lentinula edodes]